AKSYVEPVLHGSLSSRSAGSSPMSAPQTVQIVPGRRPYSRRLKLLVIAGILVLLLGAAVGAYFYVARAGEKRLRAAIALADRLDPGWRLEEIEAKRQVISDDENSARKIILAVRLMEAHVRPSTWASQIPVFTELRGQAPELQLTERQHALL